jgi:hypothetical protein
MDNIWVNIPYLQNDTPEIIGDSYLNEARDNRTQHLNNRKHGTYFALRFGVN